MIVLSNKFHGVLRPKTEGCHGMDGGWAAFRFGALPFRTVCLGEHFGYEILDPWRGGANGQDTVGIVDYRLSAGRPRGRCYSVQIGKLYPTNLPLQNFQHFVFD